MFPYTSSIRDTASSCLVLVYKTVSTVFVVDQQCHWRNHTSLNHNGLIYCATIGSIYFLPGIYPYGVSLLASILFVFWCQFQPSGGQIFSWKWGFSNFLKKLLTQFIWYLAFTYVMRLFTPIHFHVPSVNFWPLVAQHVAQIGISRLKHWQIHFIPNIYPYGKRHYSLLCSRHQFWAPGGQMFG